MFSVIRYICGFFSVAWSWTKHEKSWCAGGSELDMHSGQSEDSCISLCEQTPSCRGFTFYFHILTFKHRCHLYITCDTCTLSYYRWSVSYNDQDDGTVCQESTMGIHPTTTEGDGGTTEGDGKTTPQIELTTLETNDVSVTKVTTPVTKISALGTVGTDQGIQETTLVTKVTAPVTKVTIPATKISALETVGTDQGTKETNSVTKVTAPVTKVIIPATKIIVTENVGTDQGTKETTSVTKVTDPTTKVRVPITVITSQGTQETTLGIEETTESQETPDDAAITIGPPSHRVTEELRTVTTGSSSGLSGKENTPWWPADVPLFKQITGNVD